MHDDPDGVEERRCEGFDFLRRLGLVSVRRRAHALHPQRTSVYFFSILFSETFFFLFFEILIVLTWIFVLSSIFLSRSTLSNDSNNECRLCSSEHSFMASVPPNLSRIINSHSLLRSNSRNSRNISVLRSGYATALYFDWSQCVLAEGCRAPYDFRLSSIYFLPCSAFRFRSA